MTTIAQVRQVVKPLLQRNPDLALVGRLVVIKPVRHILRGIYIDRSLDPLLFVPKWAVIFLFEPSESFSFNWGQEIYRPPPGPGVWDASCPETSGAMCEEIERTALPLLRPVETIDDFVAFTTKDRFRHTYLDLYPDRRIFVDAARGDIEAARMLCASFATDSARRRYVPRMREEYERITKTLCPLIVANDRLGLAQHLHDWEAESVKGLKLEKLWERTPFPLESQPGQP